MLRMWTKRSVAMTWAAALSLAVLGTVGCGGNTALALEEIPEGSDVTIELEDGRVLSGKLVAVETETIVVADRDQGRRETVRRDTIAQVESPDAPGVLDRVFRDEPEFEEVTVDAGQTLVLVLDTAHASNTSSVGDEVRARTKAPVSVDGRTVIPAGSEVLGEVTEAKASGKVKGRARLGLRVGTLEAHGDEYSIDVPTLTIEADGTKKEDAAKIGIGAGAGAVIGGIAGGGKGAAVGSAIGGGAGTALVLTTAGKEVVLPSGQELSLQLLEHVTVKVPREGS